MKLLCILGRVIACAATLAPIQMLLVHFREPRAVWFWCGIAGLCG